MSQVPVNIFGAVASWKSKTGAPSCSGWEWLRWRKWVSPVCPRIVEKWVSPSLGEEALFELDANPNTGSSTFNGNSHKCSVCRKLQYAASRNEKEKIRRISSRDTMAASPNLSPEARSMYKTLSLAVLLLAVFAFTSGSKSVGAVPPSPASPAIVARGSLLNQTVPFSATIYTPAQDGVFRLSVYPTITTADPNSESSWSYGFGWTDIAGQPLNAYGVLQSANSQLGEFSTSGNSGGYDFEGGIIRTFQANKNTPITQSMSLGGPPDNSAYALYYVLERIE
jgi:hypothetical protein